MYSLTWYFVSLVVALIATPVSMLLLARAYRDTIDAFVLTVCIVLMLLGCIPVVNHAIAIVMFGFMLCTGLVLLFRTLIIERNLADNFLKWINMRFCTYE